MKKVKNVRVLNTLNITDLLVKDGKVYGAAGFSIKKEEAIVIRAKKSDNFDWRSGWTL